MKYYLIEENNNCDEQLFKANNDKELYEKVKDILISSISNIVSENLTDDFFSNRETPIINFHFDTSDLFFLESDDTYFDLNKRVNINYSIELIISFNSESKVDFKIINIKERQIDEKFIYNLIYKNIYSFIENKYNKISISYDMERYNFKTSEIRKNKYYSTSLENLFKISFIKEISEKDFKLKNINKYFK